LVQDFIDYLSDHHTDLMPYDTLAECRGNHIAYRKYTKEILKDLDIGEVVDDKSPYALIEDSEVNNFVQRIYLSVDKSEENLVLSCYPADTTGQAKNFYDLIDLEDIKNLQDKGWGLRSILHFSYIGTHLVYADETNEGTKNPLEYIKYWKKLNSEEKIKQYQESEFNELIKKLIEDNMISKRGKEKIEEEFIDTGRDHINLAPGINMTYEIPIEEAVKMDEEDSLVPKIKDVYQDIQNLS